MPTWKVINSEADLPKAKGRYTILYNSNGTDTYTFDPDDEACVMYWMNWVYQWHAFEPTFTLDQAKAIWIAGRDNGYNGEEPDYGPVIPDMQQYFKTTFNIDL